MNESCGALKTASRLRVILDQTSTYRGCLQQTHPQKHSASLLHRGTVQCSKKTSTLKTHSPPFNLRLGSILELERRGNPTSATSLHNGNKKGRESVPLKALEPNFPGTSISSAPYHPTRPGVSQDPHKATGFKLPKHY